MSLLRGNTKPPGAWRIPYHAFNISVVTPSLELEDYMSDNSEKAFRLFIYLSLPGILLILWGTVLYVNLPAIVKCPAYFKVARE